MASRILVGILTLTLCGGCAGVSPAQAGQTIGTIAGQMIAPGIGAPFGALAGLLAGMVFQKKVDQVTEKKERRELNDQLAVGQVQAPAESEAVPQGQPIRVWIDEMVQDGRVIAGHFGVRYI